MEINLSLPSWVSEELVRLSDHLFSNEERMRAVVRFARLNFERNTGGPFAAGVFERESGKLIAFGVNRVLATNCSSAHAEILALSAAQKVLKSYDLGGAGMPILQLVVNWRPCAMCFGATLWSGVRSLMIAGSGPELENITGFDEGPIHPEWVNELSKRGIELIDNVLTEEALAVYRDFARSKAIVYNGRRGTVFLPNL